jgi:hypothetical protein
MIETCISLAGTRDAVRIHLFKIGEDRFDRSMQTVEIETVETNGFMICRQEIIVSTKPPDEVEDVGISPHPGWEASETAKSVDRILIGSDSTDETIHAIGVGEIRLDGYRREPLFSDQSFRYFRSLMVELMSSVRRLTQQDKTGVTNEFDQWIIVVDLAWE